MKARSLRAKAQKELEARILEALGDESVTAALLSDRLEIPSQKITTTLGSLAKRGIIWASQGGHSEANHAPCVLWGRALRGHPLDECWPSPARVPEGKLSVGMWGRGDAKRFRAAIGNHHMVVCSGMG